MEPIQDQHLDILVCSQCQRYLSVFPIKVYENHSVKCGRCCQDGDGGTASLYQDIAKQFLFKCINRYEGCRKLLVPAEVTKHELTCSGSNYSCPRCEAIPEMPAYQLVRHFKDSHSSYFLNGNIFYLTLSTQINKENFLYVKDDNIFVIFLNYVPNYLYISAVTLRKLQNIVQQFIISLDASPFKYTTTKQECVSLDNFNDEHYFHVDVSNILNQQVKCEIILDTTQTPNCCYEVQFPEQINKNLFIDPKQYMSVPKMQMCRVELTPEFGRRFPNYNLTDFGTTLYSATTRIELLCSNCKQMLYDNVYTCAKKKHLICWECSAWCGLCECSVMKTSNDLDLLSKYLLFFCKWKCGYKYSVSYIQNHELLCYMNEQKCPRCFGLCELNDLTTHMKTVHKHKFNLDFLLSSIFISDKQGYEYFIKNDTLFLIEYIKYTIAAVGFHTTRFEYGILVKPCHEPIAAEVCIVTDGSKCQKLQDGQIRIKEMQFPKLYINYH